MRENIRDLQQRLLDSGAIDKQIDEKTGEPKGLYATIQKSMDEGEGRRTIYNKTIRSL